MFRDRESGYNRNMATIPDHRQVVAQLPQDARNRLQEKSDAAGLVHAAGHLGLIGALGWAIANQAPYWPLLMMPQGVLIVFLFCLLHEASHLTPFRTRILNKLAAWIAGFAILIPPGWFLYFHFAHHRHTQDPARDPELADPKPETKRQYLLHVSGLPVWIGNIRQLLGNLEYSSPDDFVPRAAHSKVRREAAMMLAAYAVLAAGSVYLESAVLLWTWIVPVMIGQPFLRLYLMAEHGLLPNTANMLENSRTVRSNRLVRSLAWNMPYHIEHHVWPSVPFHRLVAFHDLIKPHTPEPDAGYIAFHRAYINQLD